MGRPFKSAAKRSLLPTLRDDASSSFDLLELLDIAPRTTSWCLHQRLETADGGGMERGASMRTLTHLQRLEADSIHILREGVAESERPVMLYSVGKDSSVMLHLAR